MTAFAPLRPRGAWVDNERTTEAMTKFNPSNNRYTAESIEVLKGLSPVQRRP
jgi:hypothetical protein